MRFKHVTNVVFILSVFQLLTGTALCRGGRGQTATIEPPGLMTPAQYQQFLASLKTDLARWQAQLAEIDVGALGLDFKAGKIIEDTLSLAKQDVGLCQVYEAGLEKRQTLVYNMWLYSWMEAFLQNAGDLGDSLNSMGGNSSQARIYASELLVTQKENQRTHLSCSSTS